MTKKNLARSTVHAKKKARVYYDAAGFFLFTKEEKDAFEAAGEKILNAAAVLDATAKGIRDARAPMVIIGLPRADDKGSRPAWSSIDDLRERLENAWDALAEASSEHILGADEESLRRLDETHSTIFRIDCTMAVFTAAWTGLDFSNGVSSDRRYVNVARLLDVAHALIAEALPLFDRGWDKCGEMQFRKRQAERHAEEARAEVH